MLDAIADATQVEPVRPLETEPAGDGNAAGRVSLVYRVGYGLLVGAGLALTAVFGVFWFSPAELPRDFGPRLDAADIVLFAVLTFVVWHRLLLEAGAWIMCLRVESYRRAPASQPGLRVALITTFVPSSESLDMLRNTLAGMVVADYPHDTWVLDEGDDQGARSVCEHLGVRHFSRKGRDGYNTDGGTFAARTKGGNHNAWYAHHGSGYDIVAQVDSDFQVRRDFLTRTLGHFRDPDVAFVGTPQIYGNMGNLIARGAAQQTYMFYGPILRALSGWRMTLLIGANHIVRVAALREVGWYQGHLVEDMATGKRFHLAGWKSVYVPEALAVGEGPTTWAAYFNQQYRWAFGCMSIFFTQQHLTAKMDFIKGLTYFFLEQFYFSGVRIVLGAALLTLYYVTGWTPANLPLPDMLIWYLPLLFWRQVVFFALQRLTVRPRLERGLYWAGNIVSIAVLPVYFLAFIGVIRGKRVSFKTTPKGDSKSEELDKISVFAPHMMLAALAAAGIGAGYALGHRSPVYIGWGALSIVIYSSFVFALLWQRWRARRLTQAVRRSRLARRVWPAATLLAALLLGAAGCSTGLAVTPPAEQWSAAWKADFSGPYQGALSSSLWTYDTGAGLYGNGEIETMTTNPGNVYLDGHGNLDITAVGQGNSWSSGRVQTKRLFAPPAGGEMMVTASIRQPDPVRGMGYWPAFWLLGPGSWPQHGEIDIMEDANARDEHSGTLHCGTQCHDDTGLTSGLLPCPGCQGGYHTYSVVVDRRAAGAEQIRWYLDGRQFYSVSESQVGAAVWTEAVDHGFTIILDIAMGGTYPDNQCGCSAPNGATTAGGTMSVRSLTVSDGIPAGG